MAGKRKYERPDDDKLIEIIGAAGSVVAAANQMGISSSTVDSWLRNHDLRARAREACAQQVIHAEPVAVDDPQRVRIDQLSSVVAQQRRELKDYAEKLADQQEFFQKIVDATREPVTRPRLKRAKPSKTKPRRSVIAPVYDQQFGQFVTPSDTPGGRGDFNVAVFDERLERWVEGVTGILTQAASAYQIDEVLIPLGGDNVEGDEIFAGQAWQLELDPPRQVWQLAVKMTDAIERVVLFAREEIAAQFIGLYGIGGNHGRVGGKRGGARPATYSWDWLFQMILFDRLRQHPIDEAIIEPGGALFFRCAGHEFQAIHGDQIRGWGGLPFYGLTRFDGRSIRLHNTIYRYLLMGHHHQRAEIPNGAGETLVSGDWVGANNLSGVITAASRPQQSVIFVAEKWGVTSTERIYFEDAEQAYRSPTVHGRAKAA